jgi:hypothetical protein
MPDPIREYQTDPEMKWDGKRYVPKWQSMMSLDLREVATARPNDGGITKVTMIGQGNISYLIAADYATFRDDWRAARRRE